MEPNNPIGQPGSNPVGNDVGASIEPINDTEPEFGQAPTQPISEESPKMADIIPPPSSDGFPPMDDTSSAPGVAPIQTSPQRKSKKKLLILIVVALLIIGGAAAWFLTHKDKKTTTTTTNTSTKTNITYAVQWAEDAQRKGVYKDGKLVVKGLDQYITEYENLHPNIQISTQIIANNDYANKLQVLSDADAPPDIYQIYSTWAVSYIKNGVLDNPPADVKADVKANYVSTAGVTQNGDIWGIPTEVDDYCLLYNKDLFKAAGIVDASGNALPPKTAADYVADAAKLTKKDAKGAITQYGTAFLVDNDWEVVDPFLSLLYSNNGQYLSSDYKKAVFNSPEGVAALNTELQLFKQGSTDINGNFYDFGTGKVAMVIAPPWNKTKFKANFGDKFSTTVGVAPIPYMVKPATLQYSWFMGVTAKSQHKQEAWDFLRWYTQSQYSDTKTTPLGDLLSENIGAIPGRTVDFNAHKDVLGDFYTKTFIDQMKTSVAEPNVAQASQIKGILMKEIQGAWSGNETAQQALDESAKQIDVILAQYYK
jgi:multiple sugar transport system substrate-binding protein